jgi:hypothetical protein
MYGMELISNSTNASNPAIAARTRTNFLDPGTVVANHDAGRRYDIWIQTDLKWNVGGSNEEMIFRYSWDGVHFFDFHTFTVATTDDLRLGMWYNNRHITGAPFMINSWKEDSI